MGDSQGRGSQRKAAPWGAGPGGWPEGWSGGRRGAWEGATWEGKLGGVLGVYGPLYVSAAQVL